MFRVKICGITSAADAIAVAEAGGDAVGFNFYRGSPRYIEPEAAGLISGQLPACVVKVGVFVNETSGSIADTCRDVCLDCVQLHGDEPPSLLADLPTSLPIIRAFRFQLDDLGGVLNYLDECAHAKRLPDAVLLDKHVTGSFGGTGRTIDWHGLSKLEPQRMGLPLILAGGLNPGNVRMAIEVVRPSGVDTASGVEVSPGVKDHGMIRRFISEAKTALLDAGQ